MIGRPRAPSLCSASRSVSRSGVSMNRCRSEQHDQLLAVSDFYLSPQRCDHQAATFHHRER